MLALSDDNKNYIMKWGQVDKVRTFLLESVKDEDSFLRNIKIA